MSRAKEDELTFVLLGRDEAAPDVIRYWTRVRIALGKNQPSDPQILDALRDADTMERERRAQYEPKTGEEDTRG